MTAAYKIKFFDGPGELPAAGCNLSILLAPASFQFAVFSADQQSVLAIGDVEFDALSRDEDLTGFVSKVLADYRLLQKKFGRVYISLLNRDFAMVPDAYYSPASAPAILGFTSGLNSQRLHASKIGELHFCYGGQREILELCERSFPNAIINHAGACSLSFLSGFNTINNSDILLNLHAGWMELAVKSQNETGFYNVFQYESDEDILYYLLFSMEQLKIDPATAKICIAAQLPVTAALCSSISKYIKHVSFAVRPAALSMKAGSALPDHHYFTLLNQHLCEL